MSVYLVADIEVRDAEMLREYAQKSRLLAEKHGGVYRARGGQTQAVEGDWQPQRVVIIEFPDREAANTFLNDPEYQLIAALRHASAVTRSILVDGLN